MECGYAICSTFLPGDRHVSPLSRYLIPSLISCSQACRRHQVWRNLDLWHRIINPYWNCSGAYCNNMVNASQVWRTSSCHWKRRQRREILVTGAQKSYRWKRGCYIPSRPISILMHIQVQSGKLLSLVHVRTLKMSDDVLSVRYSPNNKLLAVALLDSTVKVFYQDTLKFFLSLYGHKVGILFIRKFLLLTRAASCSFYGHIQWLQINRHLLGRQERQNLGSRLRWLP